MSKEEYDLKLPAIEALSKDVVKEPDMPVAIALQEAEDLFAWCQSDKTELVKAGLDWVLVEDLPARIGACRYVQSQWQKDFLTQEDAQKEWRKQSPMAFHLRDELLHHFFHAYYRFPDLTGRVQKIAEGSGNADMIQDLNDLAVLGKANPDPLAKISFDLSLLDQAATLSDEMASLLAKANGEKLGDNNLKTLRDRAYAFMKMAVDEIRRNGQYVFWRHEERRKGYISKYYKQRASAMKNKEEEKK